MGPCSLSPRIYWRSCQKRRPEIFSSLSLSSKTKAPHVASIFLDPWIVKYAVRAFLLTENGLQFVSMFSDMLCTFCGVNRLRFLYHPQTNGIANGYKNTVATRLHHYVTEHQPDWDLFAPLLTAYTAPKYTARHSQPHLASSSAVKHLDPPHLSLLQHYRLMSSPKHNPKRSASPSYLVSEMWPNTDKHMKGAQQRYNQHLDAKAREHTPFHPGQLDFLSSIAFHTRYRYNGRGIVLQPSSVRPWTLFVLSTTSHLITVLQNGITNTISSYSASLAPKSMQDQDDMVDDELQTSSSTIPNKNLTEVNDQLQHGTDERSPL